MMNRRNLAVGAATLFLMAGAATVWAEGPELETLDSVEQLQDAFNKDAGSTRVVLLLSPT